MFCKEMLIWFIKLQPLHSDSKHSMIIIVLCFTVCFVKLSCLDFVVLSVQNFLDRDGMSSIHVSRGWRTVKTPGTTMEIRITQQHNTKPCIQYTISYI